VWRGSDGVNVLLTMQIWGQIHWKVFKYKYFSFGQIQIHSFVNVFKYKYFLMYFKYKYNYFSNEKNKFIVFPLLFIMIHTLQNITPSIRRHLSGNILPLMTMLVITKTLEQAWPMVDIAPRGTSSLWFEPERLLAMCFLGKIHKINKLLSWQNKTNNIFSTSSYLLLFYVYYCIFIMVLLYICMFLHSVEVEQNKYKYIYLEMEYQIGCSLCWSRYLCRTMLELSLEMIINILCYFNKPEKHWLGFSSQFGWN